jgi:hypothetical protein
MKMKNFLDDLSNSGPAVRLYREGRATARPERTLNGYDDFPELVV